MAVYGIGREAGGLRAFFSASQKQQKQMLSNKPWSCRDRDCIPPSFRAVSTCPRVLLACWPAELLTELIQTGAAARREGGCATQVTFLFLSSVYNNSVRAAVYRGIVEQTRLPACLPASLACPRAKANIPCPTQQNPSVCQGHDEQLQDPGFHLYFGSLLCLLRASFLFPSSPFFFRRLAGSTMAEPRLRQSKKERKILYTQILQTAAF